MLDTPATSVVRIPRKLSVTAVIEATSLPRTTLYRRIAAGTFPRPTLLGPVGTRRVAFNEAEINRWMADPANYQAPKNGEV